MKTSDFFYELPQELIAQTPVEPRDSSRLLILNKNDGAIEHRIFRDLTDYLNPGDCLILNDTRVIPARIYGVKKKQVQWWNFYFLSKLKIMCGSACVSQEREQKKEHNFHLATEY